jgi:hypothetical protein
MKVKDLGQSAEKFARRGGSAVEEYKNGIRNPRASWQGSTIAAEPSYNEGVQAAISRGGFGKGVQKVSDATWADKAVNKGGRNYPTAMREAGPDWQKGFAPMAATLSSLNLTPRGPRGSPGNYDRSRQVGEALNKTRVGA